MPSVDAFSPVRDKRMTRDTWQHTPLEGESLAAGALHGLRAAEPSRDLPASTIAPSLSRSGRSRIGDDRKAPWVGTYTSASSSWSPRLDGENWKPLAPVVTSAGTVAMPCKMVAMTAGARVAAVPSLDWMA